MNVQDPVEIIKRHQRLNPEPSLKEVRKNTEKANWYNKQTEKIIKSMIVVLFIQVLLLTYLVLNRSVFI